MSQTVKILITVLAPLLVLLLPESMLLAGMDAAQQRVAAVFVFAVISWILEPIPIFATSVAIIGLLIALALKRSTLWRLQEDQGTMLKSAEMMGTFGNKILILFLGGFFLALAASRYRLDIVAAKTLLKPFGTKPVYVILGLMVITAIFSMFMSNTATTAMMLAVLTPVLARLPDKDPARAAATLAIPVAANVGGIGTPIVHPCPTPWPGVFGRITHQTSLNGWPSGLRSPWFCWLFHGACCFSTALKPIMSVESFEAQLMKGTRPMIAYGTCAATVLLWLTGLLHGINSYAVAMVPIVVFTATGIVSAKDLRGMGWDILWLVAGGVALGIALNKTNLTATVIEAIPFASMSVIVLVALISFVTALMATFMSHTATANLMLPLIAALGTTLGAQLDGIGGSTSLVIAATIAASLGMALPISTPPNAIAYGSGMIEQKQMAVAGSIITIIGLVMLIPLLLIFSILEAFNMRELSIIIVDDQPEVTPSHQPRPLTPATHANFCGKQCPRSARRD